MTQSGTTFRIFVSSTFSDLKEERDALQARVFPRLREFCTQRGARFQAIDLRWGVSQQASVDQQTMNICLGEIKRCQDVTPRPNFIVLLGDRYGWCPPPSQIPSEEFERILEHVREDVRSLLERWYLRDDNALPAEYILQPWREHSYEAWGEIEMSLHEALTDGAQRAGLDEEAQFKYWASATHQEIAAGALSVEDASKHVFAFFRQIESLPEDNQAEGFRDLDNQGKPDEQACYQLDSLKAELNKSLEGNVKHYKTSWNKSGPTESHIDRLCDDVYEALKGVIERQLADLEVIVPLESEIGAHKIFGEERSSFFAGRTMYLCQIENYIEGASPHPFAIWGEPGTGKSALLAKAIQEAEVNYPKRDILYRFIGATPESSNGRALLESLCHQISRYYQVDGSDIPLDYQELVQEFPKRLALATAEKPLVVFIDALDQLSDADNARSLAWLPKELPQHVHLVVSTLPGECKEALQSGLPGESMVELEPMPIVEAEQVLDLWLQDAGRTLQSDQRSHLLDKFAECPKPLYLKLAFEEARRWRSYDGLPMGVDNIPGLSGDIPGILRDLFTRLSSETNHGELLVSRSLGYLAASKNGLTEDELLDVLARDVDVYIWFLHSLFHTPPDLLRHIQDYLMKECGDAVNRDQAQRWLSDQLEAKREEPLKDFLASVRAEGKGLRLPVVLWSRLYADLEPYLTQRNADGTSLLAFYHPTSFGQAVRDAYLGETVRETRHQALASYFAHQSLDMGEDGGGKSNVRKLSELPYQQIMGRLVEELVSTVANYPFLATKLSSMGVPPVIEDYRLALKSEIFVGEEDVEIRYAGLEIILRTLLLASHVVHEDPEQLPSQLLGRLDRDHENPIVRGLVNDATAVTDQPWIQSLKPGLISPFGYVHRSFHGHSGAVMDIVIASNGDQIISASLDKTIKVCNLENGLELYTLRGHEKGVQRLALTPDEKHVVSASWDHTLKLWDLSTGVELRTYTGHGERVLSVAISPDGKRIISGDWHGKIKTWRLDTGEELNTFKIHQDPIWSIAVSPDGRSCASGSDDRTLKVWDMDTGEICHTLEGHGDKIFGVLFSEDGQQIFSGAWDGNVKMWDRGSGSLLRSFDGKGGNVWSIALDSDNKRVMASLSNGFIKIWDIESGNLMQSLEGHTNWVSSVAVVPSGNQIVSGSYDHSIIVWDLDREVAHAPSTESEELKPPVDHGVVRGVGIVRDGKRAFAAYYDGTVSEWSLETGEKLSEQSKYYLRRGGSTIESMGRFLVQMFNDPNASLRIKGLDESDRS